MARPRFVALCARIEARAAPCTARSPLPPRRSTALRIRDDRGTSAATWWQVEAVIFYELRAGVPRYPGSGSLFPGSDHEVVFPHGTYLMRERFDVRCADG